MTKQKQVDDEYAVTKVSFKEDPPPRRDRRYHWEQIAAQLRAHPGEWAKVFDDDKNSIVTAIRQQKVKPMRSDVGIEIRTSNNVVHPVRRCTLWARYVPESDTTKEK